MIVVIRIAGRAKIRKEIEETFSRLRLGKKFTCSVFKEKPEILGMINKVKNHVAYGKINKETLTKLIEIRGRAVGDRRIEKSKAEKIVSEFLESKTEKKLSSLGIKPFFRLHPPKKGIETKLAFPKGVLGNHGEEINSLIERML